MPGVMLGEGKSKVHPGSRYYVGGASPLGGLGLAKLRFGTPGVDESGSPGDPDTPEVFLEIRCYHLNTSSKLSLYD